MAKNIQAPKPKRNLPKKTNVKMAPPKTYRTTKKTNPFLNFLKRMFIFIFWTILIIALFLMLLTYLKGSVTIPKLLDIKKNSIIIPEKTKEDIILDGTNLHKFQELKAIVTNNIKTQKYTIKKGETKTIPLAEGINKISLFKQLNLRLIKLKGHTITKTITYDTTAPKLLNTPKITQQGLVLEFTEPATIQIIKPKKHTLKTDDSYTVVIPQRLFSNADLIQLQVSDTLGNNHVFKIKLNKTNTNQQDNSIIYAKNELPESAGLLENINIIGTLSLFTLISLPSILLSLSRKKQIIS